MDISKLPKYPNINIYLDISKLPKVSKCWSHKVRLHRCLCKCGGRTLLYRKLKIAYIKVIMQGNLFQRCTNFVYCSVLSLGVNVNTRRIWNLTWDYQNLMLLTSSVTKRTLMHLFLLTNSAQRELVSICTQSIRN